MTWLVAAIVGHVVPASLDALQDDVDRLPLYHAALLSTCFMVLLGFMDDVLDLPWRYKLILPTVAALPLLVSYTGVTAVLLPHFVRPHVAAVSVWLAQSPVGQALAMLLGAVGVHVPQAAAGAWVEFGLVYYAYMGALAVFTTNAINIYAGVNGLEVGQAVVIAGAVLFTNILEMASGLGTAAPHAFSASLMAPFLGASIALLSFNWYVSAHASPRCHVPEHTSPRRAPIHSPTAPQVPG